MNPKFLYSSGLVISVTGAYQATTLPGLSCITRARQSTMLLVLLIMLILLNEDGYKLGKFSVAPSCLSCGIFCLCVIISSLPMSQGRSTIHVRSILTDLFVPHSVFVTFQEFVSYRNCFQVWYQNLIVEIINPLWL